MPTLSEADSKALLASHGLPVAPERVVATADEAVTAAAELGHPVVVKLGGDAIAHKTERGLVRLGLGDDDAVRTAADELLAAARPEDGEVHLLVAPMVRGNRELIAGLHLDLAPFALPVVYLEDELRHGYLLSGSRAGAPERAAPLLGSGTSPGARRWLPSRSPV